MTPPDETSTEAPIEASVRSTADESEIVTLIDALGESEVFLGGYTDEELSVVLPLDPDDPPLVAYPYVEMLDGPRANLVQAAALRSLVARQALVPTDDPGVFAALGSLGILVALRSMPSSLLVVERVSETQPTRWVVYGISTPSGEAVLEELVAPLGHHDFVVRSVEAQARVLAEQIADGATPEAMQGANDTVAEDATLESVVGELTEVVRLYSLVNDGEDFRELEAVVARGTTGGPVMCVFPQDSDSDDEQLLWPRPDRLSLTDLVLAVLRQDVDRLNAAMESE